MENPKPSSLDLLLYSVYSHVYAHHESLITVSMAISALRAALSTTVPGFDDAYKAEITAQQMSESPSPIQNELVAMKSTLETMRQALGIQADGSLPPAP